MSVGKTRRVAPHTPNIKRAQHYQNEANADVEKIDTTNNVLIKDDDDSSGSKRRQQEQDCQEEIAIVSDQAHIQNAINLQASVAQSEAKSSDKAFRAYEKTEQENKQDDYDELV